MHPTNLHIPAIVDANGCEVEQAIDVSLKPEYHLYYFLMDAEDVQIESAFVRHHIPLKLSLYPQTTPCQFAVLELAEYSHPIFEELKQNQNIVRLLFWGKIHPDEYRSFSEHQFEMDLVI